MNKELFNEEYAKFYNDYTDKIQQYYERVGLKKKKLERIVTIVMIMLIAIFLFGTVELSEFFQNTIIIQIIGTVAIILMCIISIVVQLKREMYNINEDIIRDIVKYISGDENCIYSPNKRISKADIEKMELFNLNNLKYNGKNAISANYNNNIMNFADMEIYYYKDKVTEEVYYDNEGRRQTRMVTNKEKKYVFNGCYMSATLNKKIAEHIYLIPNNISDLIINGRINDYITYDGDEIELENLEFSDKYKVYSDNEVQARYILSLKLMEKINEIDKTIKSKKYIVFKEGRRFSICIQDFSIESLRKSTLPIKYTQERVRENLEYIFKNLYSLFNIYNILDLGNDLYV